MLTRLKLTAVRDQLDGLLDEAGRQELSLRETLVLLCEREIARKDERRIEMTLKLARFPFVRDLSGFDFSAQPSIDPKQIRELASARWIANGENVLLLGPPGVGKTHLAVALGREAGRAFRAVRRSHHGRCAARQGSQRRSARGAALAICQTKAPDHR
jgi:DNA replication protein DnaC